MNFFRRNHNNNNRASTSNENGINNTTNDNTPTEALDKNKKIKNKQIAEFTNIRDIPLHRVQYVEFRGGDSIFLLRVSITFAIVTIVAYIILSYIVDLDVKPWESQWKKLFTTIFVSYSSGVSFIFVTWGVAFYFVSQVISQRIDAELLHNEYNVDGNKILYIRGSVPDFYHFKKELTKGCNIKLVKMPFLFNNKASKSYSKKLDDYIPYNRYTYSQFRTNSYYTYQADTPSNNSSCDSLSSVNSSDSTIRKPKSINTIQRAINNSSKLEKILIATPINLSS